MSFPSYINTIIYSQIKNQQIEQVRTQIAKLVSINSLCLKCDCKNTQASKKSQASLHFTHSNFHNQPLPQTNKRYLKDIPQAIIDKGNAHKMKERMSLALKQYEIGLQTERNSPEQSQRIMDWKNQMMMHLKCSRSQKKSINKGDLLTIKKERCPKIMQKSKSIHNVSKKFYNQPLSKEIKTDSQVATHKNIILIRPFSFHQGHEDESAFKFVPKFRKSFHKNQLNLHPQLFQNHLTLQSMANFYALVPYLDSKKAQAEPKIPKKKKYSPILYSKNIIEKPTFDEFKGNLCGWDIGSKDQA